MFEVGEDIEFFTTHTIENCYVNDLPLCYEVGLRDQVYSQPLGQLIAVQCEDVTFTSMDASRASIGIELAYCKDVVLERCIADDAGIFGIYVAKSEDCVVYRCPRRPRRARHRPAGDRALRGQRMLVHGQRSGHVLLLRLRQPAHRLRDH